MVSSSLDMDLTALYATLQRLRIEHAADPEYAAVRSALPEDWPL